MKDPRLVYAIPIAATVALLILSLMAYAAFLTSAWGTLLGCAPAILVTIGIVSGMAVGTILFSTEESETATEAARPDGAALLDRLGSWLVEHVHRLAIRLHVHGVGH